MANNDTSRSVIKSERPAAAIYNGCACTVLREITPDDGPVFTDKNPQVLCLVDDREVYFYADEVVDDEEAAKNAKVRPDYLPPNLRAHAATPDQAAWDAASMNPTVQSIDAYLIAFPMGAHATAARQRRAQIAPGLPPLPPLPKAMTDNMPGQAPLIAKDEERNVPKTGNHPEYGESEDQRKAREAMGQAAPGDIGPGKDEDRSAPRSSGNRAGETTPSDLKRDTLGPAAGNVEAPKNDANATASIDEENAWKAASDKNTVAALDNYINRYPNGAHTAQAQARKAVLTG